MKAKLNEFAGRRKAFLKKLKSSVALIPSAPVPVNVGHGYDYYRQASHFYYLTGIEEAECFLLLAPHQEKTEQLFLAEADPHLEKWQGKMLGTKGARAAGFQHALANEPQQIFDDAFVEAMMSADSLFYRVGVDPMLDQRVFRLLQKVRRQKGRRVAALTPIQDPEGILSEMRLIKSASEIDRIRRAADITAQAHVNAMRFAKPGVFEYELEAVLSHTFRALGARGPAYNFIVASGENACTLHYSKNDRRIKKGDLVLIDAGAEYDFYASDVTRTFPSGTKFSREQAEIYSAVLRAQKEAIATIKPGQTVKGIHDRVTEVLTEELLRLKILKGKLKNLIKDKAYHDYFFHGTSHYLGLDTHDVGRYYEGEKPLALEPGMVLTVEPGLYFLPKSKAPKRYKGIGVRIEDDILVTATGCEVLTNKVPKEMEEIESLSGEQ